MKKITTIAFFIAVCTLPSIAQIENDIAESKDSITEVQSIDSVAITDDMPENTFSNDSTENLLDENNVTDAYTPSTVGPNRKWHRQIYLQLGFMADNPNTGAAIRYGLSTQWGIGFRAKRRFNNTFSATNEWGYRAAIFNLKQEDAKIVPNSIKHRTEKIDFHSITTALHLRINVGKRGNYIGNFIEFGGYGGYAFLARHLTWDKLKDSQASSRRVTEKGLNYINRLDYGLSGKIGVNKWSVFARYRLSDMFKQSSGFPEMSKLTIGIDFGI